MNLDLTPSLRSGAVSSSIRKLAALARRRLFARALIAPVVTLQNCARPMSAQRMFL